MVSASGSRSSEEEPSAPLASAPWAGLMRVLLDSGSGTGTLRIMEAPVGSNTVSVVGDRIADEDDEDVPGAAAAVASGAGELLVSDCVEALNAC